LSLAQAISSSPAAADSFRQFIAERIDRPEGSGPSGGDGSARQALIGSQLIGLAFQRYVLRAEPVASADPDQLAAWVGPAIDRYLHQPVTGTAGHAQTAAHDRGTTHHTKDSGPA
jgi:Tetracyclin repressor-like, C-terminal domain